MYADLFDNNPFAPPETISRSGETDSRPAAAIRQAFLDHEASVQSVGLLYLIGCGVCVASGVYVGLMALQGKGSFFPQIILALLVIGLGFMQGMIGSGLRQLKRWTRTPVTLLAVVGLLAIPVGTIINGYILYLLFSSKGTMVFSDQYKEIIRRTPEIKYRTSVIVWIFLGLLGWVLLFILIVIALS